jgi:nucleoside-diphosphate-sugar epimerase
MPAWTRIPLVYAGDVAEAAALALERPSAAGRAYNVTGGDATLWEFFLAWRTAGGASARLALPIPAPVDWRYDTTRAETELGWRSRSAVDGVRETLALETAAASAHPEPWRTATEAV